VKIPGLDDALSRLDRLQNDMIPLLERIATGLDSLVYFAERQNEWNERNGH